MSKRIFTYVLMFVLFLFIGVYDVFAQTCDQTFSNATGLVSAISSAGNGTTICLNNGSYGTLTFSGFNRTGYVTVRSTTGQGATLTADFDGNNNFFIRLQSLTITGVGSGSGGSNCPRHIQLANNNFGTSQVAFRTDTCGSTTTDITVDGNTFGAYNAGGSFEGRLFFGFGGSNLGIVVTNNTFGPGGCSDGMQIGNVGGITIGPGNTFQGMPQGGCGPHVDGIQFLNDVGPITITQNMFIGEDVFLGSYDVQSHNITVTNNVFRNPQNPPNNTGQQQFQMCGNNYLWNHNTFAGVAGLGVNIVMGCKSGNGTPNNWVWNNNIFDNADLFSSGDTTCDAGNNCGTGLNNLLSNGGSIVGLVQTGTVSGTTDYIGGANPSTWAGYQLDVGSPGENAGSDAADIGTLYYGTAVSGPPTVTITAPTSSATYSTSSSSLTTLAGTASDDVSVTSVTWSCDVCGSGTATNTTSWFVSSIPLQPGENVITVSAHDGDGQTADDILTVTYTPPNPVVVITAPTSSATYSTNSSTLTTLAGTATDDVGVTSVTWSCDVCGSGTATCASCGASATSVSWSVASITLQLGANVITITGHDGSSNTGTDVITVAYSLADFTSNLLSWWKLDGTTTDAGSNAQNGTLVGSPSYDVQANCRVGTGCLLLTGSPQAMTVVQNGEYNLHASPFTIAVWIKDDTSAATLSTLSHRIVSWNDGTNGIWLGLGSTNGTTRYFYISNRTGDGINLATATSPSTGWHHVVATFDGTSTYHLYLDGVQSEIGDAGVPSPFTGNSTTLYIGQRGDGTSGTYTIGTVDDVRIYNRALSTADVSGLYLFTGGTNFLNNPTGLSLSGNTTITFLSNPSGVGLIGNTTITFLGNPTGVGLTGNTAITFLGNPTGISVTHP